MSCKLGHKKTIGEYKTKRSIELQIVSAQLIDHSLRTDLITQTMAFFGLTALGPQNSLLSASKTFRNLQIFEEEDYVNAWIKVNQSADNKFCDEEKLGDLMREVFHGPVPPNDNACIVRAFEALRTTSELPGKISFPVYIITMLRLAQEAEEEENITENNPLPSCEYTSSQLIQDDMLRNRRCKQDPNQKLNATLTCSQEYGWHKQEELATLTRAARTQSDITKFAAELIKNGVYY